MSTDERPLTLKDRLHGLMRAGNLDKLDMKISKTLFANVSVQALRKLLKDHYSIRESSRLSHKKIVEMCLMRFYKGSESSRQSAARMFLDSSNSSVRDYLDRSEEEIMDELTSAAPPVTVLDDEPQNLSETSQEFSLNSSTTSREISHAPTDLLKDKNIVKTDRASNLQQAKSEADIVFGPTSVDRRPVLTDGLACIDPVLQRITTFSPDDKQKVVKLDINDFLMTDSVGRKKTSIESSARPQCMPVILGLAEPPFYDISACLANFTVSSTSIGDLNTNTVKFDAPLLSPDEVVILSFRSIGTSRDNRLADHPLGLVCAVNDETGASFSRVPQPLTAKAWLKTTTILDPPIVLLGIKPNSPNRLDFSFPKLPENVKYGTHYQGYVFVAKSRVITDLLKEQKRIPATESIRLLLSLLTGTDGNMAPANVSFPLICPITYKTLEIPCRGVGCKHSSCFEGSSYLQVYQKCENPRWKCVVCGELVGWYDIRMDELTAFMLGTFPNCDKINVLLEDKNLVFRGVSVEPGKRRHNRDIQLHFC